MACRPNPSTSSSPDIADHAFAADDLLFATRAGTPISRNTFRTRVWLPAVKASGVDFDVRVHDLRHAHAKARLALITTADPQADQEVQTPATLTAIRVQLPDHVVIASTPRPWTRPLPSRTSGDSPSRTCDLTSFATVFASGMPSSMSPLPAPAERHPVAPADVARPGSAAFGPRSLPTLPRRVNCVWTAGVRSCRRRLPRRC